MNIDGIKNFLLRFIKAVPLYLLGIVIAYGFQLVAIDVGLKIRWFESINDVLLFALTWVPIMAILDALLLNRFLNFLKIGEPQK